MNGGEVDAHDRQNCRVGGGDDVLREHRGVSDEDSHDRGANGHESHEDGENGENDGVDLPRKHHGVNDKETYDRGVSGYENHENGGGDGALEILGTRKDERTSCYRCVYLCLLVG